MMSDNPYAGPEALENGPTKKSRWKSIVFELLTVAAILSILVALLLPGIRGTRDGARRTQCKINLKQIGLALHNYHDDYGTLPPAYTFDSSGKPLHSWRTLILPYLDELALYSSIDLSKPWNDPANAEAFKTVPDEYQCPSTVLKHGFTTYLAVVGANCCIHPTEPRAFSEITDGMPNTLIVVEVAHNNAVPWMAPQDADQQMVLSFLNGGKLVHAGGTQALRADGSVRFLSENMDSNTLRALTTIAGNEVVGEY